MQKNPDVSILLAVRNESENIERCVNSLLRQNVKGITFEILIGDDNSEDDTYLKCQNYVEKHENISLHTVTSIKGSARGKANVLAHLAQKASGELLLFTDADMSLPSTWLQVMYENMEKKQLGILTGVTQVKGEKWWESWQSMEWLFALGLIKLLSDNQIPITAMGNNMMVRKEAYQQTGGYEKIPFSVTEDVALFRQVINHKWKFGQVYQKEVMGETLPVSSLKIWLRQRKRWMYGTRMMPVYLQMLLFINSLYLPLILLIISVGKPLLGTILFSADFIIKTLLLQRFLYQLKVKKSWLEVLSFQPTYLLLYLLATVNYLLPVNKVLWKGRKY